MVLQKTLRSISVGGNSADAGFRPMVDHQQPPARNTSRRVLRLLGRAVVMVSALGAFAAEPVLTRVSGIKLLTPQEAALGRLVRLRGVITVWLGGRNGSFLQDETGGVFVAMRQGSTTFVRVGDWVECRGRTAAGGYAPMVELEQFDSLGRKEIAALLNLAENTVKNHVHVILEKLGAQDRTQAVTNAIKRGILHIG